MVTTLRLVYPRGSARSRHHRPRADRRVHRISKGRAPPTFHVSGTPDRAGRGGSAGAPTGGGRPRPVPAIAQLAWRVLSGRRPLGRRPVGEWRTGGAGGP